MTLKKFGEFETAHNEKLEEEKANAWKNIDAERVIIGTEWRAAGKWGTIGIIAVHNTKMNHWTALLGMADDNSSNEDAVAIANWGSGLMEEEAKAFFPHIKNIKYKQSD